MFGIARLSTGVAPDAAGALLSLWTTQALGGAIAMPGRLDE
jgi:hypothetical protein